MSLKQQSCQLWRSISDQHVWYKFWYARCRDYVDPILEEAYSQAYPKSASCVQRFDDSLNSAIRINLSHFAAFFIVARTEISVAKSCSKVLFCSFSFFPQFFLNFSSFPQIEEKNKGKERSNEFRLVVVRMVLNVTSMMTDHEIQKPSLLSTKRGHPSSSSFSRFPGSNESVF